MMTNLAHAIEADGRSARAQARRKARREEILTAGEQIFGGRGYRNTSVADVIDAAGISRGTFYLYFDGKDALFQELVDRFVQRVMEVIEVVEPGAGPRPQEQIFQNVKRVVDLLFDNPDLTILILREAVGLDDEVDAKLASLHGFVHDMVVGAVHNGVQMGIIRCIDERIAATAIIGAIKEVLYQAIVVDRPDRADRKKVAQALYEFGLRGLQA